MQDFNPRSREGSDPLLLCITLGYKISIHAPAKGATDSLFIANIFLINFNPRSREGSDRQRGSDCGKPREISIHAPAKGATLLLVPKNYQQKFQSTLPRRERLKVQQKFFLGSIFQSTLPRRERPYENDFIADSEEISIHAPAKGATVFINIFSLAVRLFFISSHQ